MSGNVFISYASADQQTADKLVAEIERRGIRCWISSRDIRPGEDYQGAIVAAVEASAVVLLLFSRHANVSADIPRELGLAGRFKKTVIPARLEDIVPSGSFAYQMTTAQFIDLFRDFEAKVDELCSYLAETLQVADVVRQRIAREQRRRTTKRKLRRAGIGALVLLILAGIGFAMAPRLEGWLTALEHPEAAPQPPSSSAPAQVAQAVPAQPAPPVASPETPPLAAAPAQNPAPPAPVAAAPLPAQLPKGVLASRTYEGIRFDVMSANADGRNLNVLVTATNTQPRKVKLKAFTRMDPTAIDDRGTANDRSATVSGIPICSRDVKDCSDPDPTNWSDAYQGGPIDILMKFTGDQIFSGSNVSVSFYVLLGVETADGEPLQTALIPVAFTNLPLKSGATVPPALASRTYEGIRFDVVSANADGRNLNVLVTATNTQPRKVKLKAFTRMDPTAIDNRGTANDRSATVSGIPICSRDVKNCSQPDPANWSNAYQDGPIDILLKFTGSQIFSGSNVSVSFNVLLGVEAGDGESLTTKVIPVSFQGLALKLRNP